MVARGEGIVLILNVIIHGKYEYAESWPEMVALIEEVEHNLRSERAESQWVSPGEVATFMFAEGRHSASARGWWPDNALQVSVNSTTGYGGLIWYASQGRNVEGEISEFIWVSDNPSPPDFDPRVVADPGIPTLFNPRSAVPIASVLAALEEFCRLGTGDRPGCIHWVHGELNGEHYDQS